MEDRSRSWIAHCAGVAIAIVVAVVVAVPAAAVVVYVVGKS